MSDPRLKSIVERIENLREEKRALTADERDIFSEAKGHGYDGKALREVLKRRAMDESARDEWDSLIDLYEIALGAKKLATDALQAGSSIREAAKASGLSTGSVAALASVQKTKISEHQESCGGGESRPASEPTRCDASESITKAGVAPSPQDLTIPLFLRRTKHGATAQ